MEKHLTDVISQKPTLSVSFTSHRTPTSTTNGSTFYITDQKKEAAFTIITC